MSVVSSGLEQCMAWVARAFVRFSAFLDTGTTAAQLVEFFINLGTAALLAEVISLCFLQFFSVADPGVAGQDDWMPLMAKRIRKRAERRKAAALRAQLRAGTFKRDSVLIDAKTGEVIAQGNKFSLLGSKFNHVALGVKKKRPRRKG